MMAGKCPDCPAESLGSAGRGHNLVVTSVVAPILATFLVSNRLYWRFRMLGRFGLDDLATVLATVSPGPSG